MIKDLIKAIDDIKEQFGNEKVEIAYCYKNNCENKCWRHIDNKKGD